MEESVLKWFEHRGIKQTTPEDIVQPNKHKLSVKIIERVRKLSAPD